MTDKRSLKDVDWAVGINKKILQILGIWIYPKETRWQTIRSNLQMIFFTIGLFYLILFPQALALIKVRSNLTLVIDNILPSLSCAAAEFKMLIPWYNKKEIFEEIKRDWLVKKSIQDKNIMIKYANIARLMTIVGLSSAFMTATVYHSPIMFGFVSRTLNNITDNPDYPLVLQTVYFYDITSTPYIYYLTVIGQLVGAYIWVLGYSGSDVLFATILMHVCGQLEILSNNIQIIVNSQTHNFQEDLKMNIRNHYRLIRFVHDIEKVFNLMLLAVFGSVSITLCILEFQLINVFSGYITHVPVLTICFYFQSFGCAIFLMFVYAWVGENLVTQCDAVHTAICNCNWIVLESKKASQLIPILACSQYPLKITIGKFVPVTLSTFAALLKTSGAYASFLLAMQK